MSDELMVHFLVEGRELLAAAERDLARLTVSSNDTGALDSCFRAVHTLKGSTGLFDLKPMGDALHLAEDLLTSLKSSAAAPLADVRALVLLVDQLGRWFDALEQGGVLPTEAAATAAVLTSTLQARVAAHAQPATGSDLPEPKAWRPAPELAAKGCVVVRYVPRPDCYFAGDDPLVIVAATPGLTELRLGPRAPWGPLGDYDPYNCNLVIEASFAAERASVEAAFRYVADQVEIVGPASTQVVPPEPQPLASATKTLRVEAARVDELVNLANDLVAAKAGLSDLAAWSDRLSDGRALGEALRAQQAQLDRLVAEMHAAVGRVRLAPLSLLFQRLPRLAREIAQALDKDVTLHTTGGGVEVDKTIADALFEPLLHVLRNAIDHGVEPPAVRARLGKPASAIVRLTARTSADRVVIEVADDGPGIDVARVRAQAVARGLISQETADRLDDAAAIDLVFTAGFSTAEAVSAVSGRGVGMDVVRDAAAQLGGTATVHSVRGQGSTIRLTLPATLSLTKILVAACGPERYGLPLDSIVETAKVPAERIVPVRAGRAFMRRGQATPLVALAPLLGGPAPAARPVERVVVTRVGSEEVGFIVDAIVDRMDVVVRPMTGLLAGVPRVAGTTLAADGAVLMVLNLAEVLG